MSNENAMNAEESLRSKRKFGKKGMAPTLKMSMLSKPEGEGTPSIFDPMCYASDESSVEKILIVTKTQKVKKNKNSARGRGLSIKDENKDYMNPRNPNTKVATKVIKKKKNKAKKRRSLTMSKGPDDDSSSEDDDEASAASGKPRNKKAWVASKGWPQAADVKPGAYSFTELLKTKKASKVAKTKASIDQGYDSDTSGASGVRPASMRMTLSADRDPSTESSGVDARKTLKPFGGVLSPVRDEEEYESELERETFMEQTRAKNDSEEEIEMDSLEGSPDSTVVNPYSRGSASILQGHNDRSLDTANPTVRGLIHTKTASGQGRSVGRLRKQSRMEKEESEESFLSVSSQGDTSPSPLPSPSRSPVPPKKKISGSSKKRNSSGWESPRLLKEKDQKRSRSDNILSDSESGDPFAARSKYRNRQLLITKTDKPVKRSSAKANIEGKKGRKTEANASTRNISDSKRPLLLQSSSKASRDR